MNNSFHCTTYSIACTFSMCSAEKMTICFQPIVFFMKTQVFQIKPNTIRKSIPIQLVIINFVSNLKHIISRAENSLVRIGNCQSKIFQYCGIKINLPIFILATFTIIEIIDLLNLWIIFFQIWYDFGNITKECLSIVKQVVRYSTITFAFWQ